ncbi:MAG: glycosyltransferase family 2 protein [Pseudomonadota bacterium]
MNVFYDPYHDLDKKHVARFSGENIHIYNCRYSSHKTAVFLRKIGALKPVMHHAIFDELVPLEFYKLYRGRRDLRWFKGSVSAYFNERGRDEVAERFGVAFRKRYRKMARQKAQQEQSAGIDDAISDAPPPVADESGKKEVKSPPLAVDLPARKNDSCLMVTTMKNEGPFMLEWVAYNRSIGFTDFLIYTNHCDDGTDKIANRLEEIGVAHHINNKFKKGMSPQRAALRKALKHDAYNRADWAICADCDEFLNIRAGDGKLPDLFDALGETDAISFCWKIFGCGDQVEYRDQFVTEQFTWSAPEQYRDKYRALGLKTMFRPGRGTTRFGVHRPKFDNGQPEGFIWKDASGNLVPDQLFSTGWSAWNGFGNDLARLHHYSVRSVDSFLVKRDRGRTNHVDRDQGLTYWADMNLNIEEDKSIVPRVKDMREEFEALLTDEKLSRLHAESCSWHAGKIASLKSNEVWALFHKQLQEINRTGQDPKECIELLKEFAAE